MNKRIAVVGAGRIGAAAAVATSLLNAGARQVEPVEIRSRVTRNNDPLSLVENEARGLKHGSFKDRVAAMQTRGTIRACVKNARRAFNREARKQVDANTARLMADFAFDDILAKAEATRKS